MNEWESAKKIGVGTITGVYNQKLLSLKNVKIADFKKLRDEFVVLLKGLKLNPDSDQEPSEILKQTQKDVFLEENFIEGLYECESQFDLIETLPIIGLPLQVKRSLSIAQDPWLIEIQRIPKEVKSINSIELFHKDYKLPWKSVENEKLSYINCILPLCGPKEEDMFYNT